MSDVLLPPPLAWVELEVRTSRPLLEVEGSHEVTPPAALDLAVRSDAKVGATAVDSLGRAHPVGVEAGRALVPADGLSSGAGALRLVAVDDVGNATEVRWPVLVQRPPAHALAASASPSYALDASARRAHELRPGAR